MNNAAARFLAGLITVLPLLAWDAAVAGEEPVSAATPPAAAAGEADAEGGARFDVWEYRVRGNTLLPAVDVEGIVYPWLGPGRSVDDVNQARAALEQAYREAGYPTVYVDLPEQDVAGGIVLLTVTEGRVGRFTVTGSRYFSNGWIRAQIPEAQPGRVPRVAEFQRQLALVNARSQDRTLTPVLRPGKEPGTVDVELKVKDELPLHGSFEVNNRNSADTSETRASASLRYDNLWQQDDSFGIQYQVAPEKPSESTVWVGTYILRPEGSDKTFVFYGLHSDSDVATVGSIESIGKGKVFGTRALIPLPPGDGLYQSLSLGADYKDFDQTVGFNEAGQEDVQTPISYINWSLGWNASIPGEALSQNLNATVNFGVRGLGNYSQEFADKRYQATPDYIFLTAGYGLEAPAWLDTSVAWSVSGQLSGQPLIDNEQFTAGGADSVRGYYEAEVLGDYGLQTSLEWRTPVAGAGWMPGLDKLYGFVFTDWATLGLHDPLPGQRSSFALGSAGLGLRLDALGFVTALDWARTLKEGPSTPSGDDRVLFSARYGF